MITEQPPYKTSLSLDQNPNLLLVYVFRIYVYDCLQNQDTGILQVMSLSELQNCDDLQTVVIDVRIIQESQSTNSYMIKRYFKLLKSISDLRIPLHFEDIHKSLSVLLKKYPVFLKNFLSRKCIFQTGSLRRTQMDLCKIWYFCRKPNRICQVAKKQMEMVTSLEVRHQKNTEDNTRLATIYSLHASLSLRTSSSKKVKEKKENAKPKQR